MRSSVPRLFISYRRSDSSAEVAHLYDRLAGHYGRASVYRDIDDIPYGHDYREHVDAALSGCDIVIAVMGPDWRVALPDGTARIDAAHDPVRIEIEAALVSGALVVPLLVGGAVMPASAALPASLEPLAALNAARIDSGRDFERQLAGLLASLDRELKERGKIVTRITPWVRPAALVSGALAMAPVLVLGISLLAGLALGIAVVDLAVTGFAFFAALALGLLAADLCSRGRIRAAAAGVRPILAGLAAYVIAMPAIYLGGSALADLAPLRDPVHLGKTLLGEFAQGRERLNAQGEVDFTSALALVEEIREIDPENGNGWYFAGEIRRASSPALFDSTGCFRGWQAGAAHGLHPFQQDFFRYIEIARKNGSLTQSTDWNSTACYETGTGFCAQRTAWIYHLLANDHYRAAQAQTGDARRQLLEASRDYVGQALRFVRPEGGRGFTQCLDSGLLDKQIAQELRKF